MLTLHLEGVGFHAMSKASEFLFNCLKTPAGMRETIFTYNLKYFPCECLGFWFLIITSEFAIFCRGNPI